MLLASSLVTCSLIALFNWFGILEAHWWNAPAIVFAFLLAYLLLQKSRYNKMAEGAIDHITKHPFTSTTIYDADPHTLKFLQVNAGILFPQVEFITFTMRVEFSAEGTCAFWGALIWGVVSVIKAELFSAAVCSCVVLFYFLSGVWNYFATGDKTRDSIMAAMRWFKACGINYKTPPTEQVKEAARLYAKNLAMLKQIREDLNSEKQH